MTIGVPAYQAQTYLNGDGVTTNFVVPFPYILQAHVIVYINGAPTGSYSWVNPSTIGFTVAPAAGVKNIRIRRITPIGAMLHQIQTGSILPADINLDTLQLLYLIQEAQDNLTGPLELYGNKITGLGNGSDANDAVNISQINALVATALAQGVVIASAPVYASYAAARAVATTNFANGILVYIKGNSADIDGGQGYFRLTNVDPSYADDSGAVLKHASNLWWFVRVVGSEISVNWYTVYKTNTGQDSSPAIRAAIAASAFFKIARITFYGTLWCTTQITNGTFGWTIPSGTQLIGVGRTHSLTATDTNDCDFIYNGTAGTDMFDLRNADLAGQGGLSNLLFKDFEVECLNGTGFMSVNRLRQNGAAYTSGVGTYPGFAQNIKFKGIKATGTFGRGFFYGKEVFELSIDHDCEFMNFFRTIECMGCDDGEIKGRYQGSASRHIQLGKEGTFGNSNVIAANFLGLQGGSDVSENHYAIYDTADSTVIMYPYIEMDVAQTRAGMYLGGSAGSIYSPKVFSPGAGLPYFELDANAVDYKMYSPEAPTGGSVAAPIIAATSNFIFGGGGYSNYNIQIFNPSDIMTSRFALSQRVQIVGGSGKTLGYGRTPRREIGLSANGIGLSRFQVTPQDPGPIVGIISGPTAVVADAGSGNYCGQAIQLPTLNGDGFKLNLVCGRDFQNGDTIKYRILCRCPSTPGAGTLRARFEKNAVVGTTQDTTSNTEVVLTDSLVIAGYATNDILSITVINNGMSIAGLVGFLDIINTSHA